MFHQSKDGVQPRGRTVAHGEPAGVLGQLGQESSVRCAQAPVLHRLPSASLPAVQFRLTERRTHVRGLETKGPTIRCELVGSMQSRNWRASVGQRIESLHRAHARVLALYDLKLVSDAQIHVDTVI